MAVLSLATDRHGTGYGGMAAGGWKQTAPYAGGRATDVDRRPGWAWENPNQPGAMAHVHVCCGEACGGVLVLLWPGGALIFATARTHTGSRGNSDAICIYARARTAMPDHAAEWDTPRHPPNTNPQHTAQWSASGQLGTET